MTGTDEATCTALPLDWLFVVTIAVSVPAVVGLTESVTVNAVDVALVTVPTAPLLNTTVFCDGVESKPTPFITIEPELIARLVELAVTAGLTVAT